MSLPMLIAVAGLAGVGAALRRCVDGAVGDSTETRLPLGILAVNLSGAFALGLLTGAGASTTVARLFGIGLLGGYTTFSAWMLGARQLARRGHRGPAARYLAISLLLGLGLVWLGRVLGAAL